ncbi:MAG: 50S ribosomal protein L19 [Verrucomicrobiota bacterium]
MKAAVIDKISQEQCKQEITPFRIGDTLKVHVKIKEGEKERIQMFTGIAIARDGTGSTETFTVRRVSHGEGVERVFPLHSPNIPKIEVERRGKARRAKLYYLRNRTGKKAKVKERR